VRASRLFAAQAEIIGNNVFGNRNGITTESFQAPLPSDQIRVEENFVHDNIFVGIAAIRDTLICRNTVSSHSAANASGIKMRGASIAEHNVVFDNDIGVLAHNDMVVLSANRVYDNRIGIEALGTTKVDANHVYSNTAWHYRHVGQQFSWHNFQQPDLR
jgi:hypothetical protein